MDCIRSSKFDKQPLSVNLNTRDMPLDESPISGARLCVGAIVALTYVSAIDDTARFKSSKGVGAHFGLTPKKYQSGETDITGRISKIGDEGVRTALYEAGNIILTRPLKGCTALKSWAMRLAKRAGMKKAKVALARKLAVIMHRMLVDGTLFKSAAVAAERRAPAGFPRPPSTPAFPKRCPLPGRGSRQTAR